MGCTGSPLCGAELSISYTYALLDLLPHGALMTVAELAQSAGDFDRLAKQLGGCVGEVVAALERLSQAMALTEEDNQ